MMPIRDWFTFKKTALVFNMLEENTIDVGRYDPSIPHNRGRDENFNYIFGYRSLREDIKGQKIIIKCDKEEVMGPFFPPDEGIYILRPNPSYFYGAIGLFSDDVLGQIIEMIINECNGHIKKDKGKVEMGEIEKAMLLKILKEKYMNKIKDRSIKLLSKSFMGRMIAETIYNHERVKVDRDIFKKNIDRIEQEAVRAVSPTAREEVLTEGLQQSKAIKDVGFIQVIKEPEKKK